MFGYSNHEIKKGTFIFPEDTSLADTVYNELATFRMSNLFFHTGVSAWMKARKLVLLDMTFDAYYMLWKQ